MRKTTHEDKNSSLSGFFFRLDIFLRRPQGLSIITFNERSLKCLLSPSQEDLIVEEKKPPKRLLKS
jgi:hypothetical protein